MIWKKFLLWALIIVAYIWIPIGTPDDLITTLPIIAFFGWKIFIMVSALLLFLLWRFGALQMLVNIFR